MAKLTYLDTSDIVANPLNVRDVTSGTELVKSLFDEGLKKPLIVASFDADHVPHWLETAFIKFSGPVNIVADGNRRFDGVCQCATIDKEAFERKFPKGIPCEVVVNPTPEQFWRIVQECSEGKNLSTNAEFYRLFKAMKSQNSKLDHAKFVDTFGSVLNVTKTRRIELNELEAKIRNASDAIERSTFIATKRKALQDAHKGIFQTWSAVIENKYVEQAYLFTETGVKPEGFPLESLCRVTGWGTVENSSAARLQAAWKAIKEINAEAHDEAILPAMAQIKTEQDAKDNKEKDTTPYAAIAKAVRKVDAAKWLEIVAIYEAEELRKAEERKNK